MISENGLKVIKNSVEELDAAYKAQKNAKNAMWIFDYMADFIKIMIYWFVGVSLISIVLGFAAFYTIDASNIEIQDLNRLIKSILLLTSFVTAMGTICHFYFYIGHVLEKNEKLYYTQRSQLINQVELIESLLVEHGLISKSEQNDVVIYSNIVDPHGDHCDYRVQRSELLESLLPFKYKGDISMAVDLVKSSKSLFVSNEDVGRVLELVSKALGATPSDGTSKTLQEVEAKLSIAYERD
ncbi:TPA: hypothetical protein I7E55_002034 [Vibrio cholerae]|nr:hypothetical protein [Vibrio cholerae]